MSNCISVPQLRTGTPFVRRTLQSEDTIFFLLYFFYYDRNPMYYSMSKYRLVGFRRSKTKHKKYDAILRRRGQPQAAGSSPMANIYVPFGDKRFENFRDKTGLNLYPSKIHKDKARRTNYRSRHRGFLKKNHYSPGYFSYNYLW